MKVFSDKNSSLAYDIFKDPEDKMEIALKKELDATKSALKFQTIRCRQLVAAFTRKLHEKELELRASKDLRDQQLSRLLRALLILESRLKKEQKLIRRQLEEKDQIIENQEKEICKYKRMETCKRWPDSNALIKGEEVNEEITCNKQENELSRITGTERLDNLCKKLISSSSMHLEHEKQEENGDTRIDFKNLKNTKKEENTFKDNPVLESVNQILLRDEDELLKTAKPVSLNVADTVINSNEGDATEWYETNGNIVADEQINNSAWCINVVEGEPVSTKKDVWIADKTSPVKSQHLEEKVCLEMSKKNLTIVDLEGIDAESLNNDRASSPVKSTASYEEIIPVTKNINCKPPLQKPPALPPKPARLLKPHQLLHQKFKDSATPSNSPGQQTENRLTKPKNTESNSNKPMLTVKKPLPCQNSQIPMIARHRNAELKPVKLLEGGKSRSKPLDPISKSKKNQGNSQIPTSLALSSCLTPFAKPKKKEEPIGNCGAIKIGSSVSTLITGLSRETIVTELNRVSSQDDSHVSHLVRQFEVLGKFNMENSIHPDNEANDIRKNFEEFKLDDNYAEVEENGRHDGDGAENKSIVNYYATLTIVPPPLPKEPPPESDVEYKMYETFLENTGLSQKSILTPSRMLSNHRSCLKPKDVKHRSKVKAAAAIDKCNLVNTSNGGGSTVKYWTEPFL